MHEFLPLAPFPASARAASRTAQFAGASLPWYDLPEVRHATDRLWAALARALTARGIADVPPRLDRSVSHPQQWRSPRLVFSQACGYDAVLDSRPHLRVVATPRYRAPSCEGSRYSSLIVVRESASCRTLADLRGARCAVNSVTSHSGMNALRGMVAPLHRGGRFFSCVSLTGSHERSLAQIQGGFADVAGIDCVTHELIRRHRPSLLHGTRVLAQSPHAAAPPYVSRRGLPEETVQRMRLALQEVMDDPDLAPVRETLLLDGVDHLPPTAHDDIIEVERRALAQGYDLLGEMRPAV